MGKALAAGQKSDLILRSLGTLEESQAGDASAGQDSKEGLSGVVQ